MMLGATVGCGAPSDEDADLEPRSSSEVESELKAMADEPAPIPFDYPIPALDRMLRRPTWDLQRYFDELERPRALDLGQCYQYYVKIFDPVRGRDIRVPVTVC
jgi:hypothetical protein